MQNIIELCEWFDDYTKKLVGQLYYEGNLENGKDFKGLCEAQTDNASNGVMQEQNDI